MTEKKFCMLCPFFKPLQYDLGWCKQKEHYLEKLLRYCAVGSNSGYALTDGRDNILKYWKRGIVSAEARHNLLQDFYQSSTPKANRDE